jgi:aspartyl-tRNA synthetase
LQIREIVQLKDQAEITNLYGWVDNVRDHGGLTFVDLRDFDSSIQLVFDKDSSIQVNLKNEFYIEVSGVLKKRDEGLINKKVALGDFEVEVSKIIVISQSKTLPFQIEDGIETDESIRLKYRY